MKFVVKELKIGETLSGRVEELLAGGDVVICFDGDLIRVHNETRRTMRIGETVAVEVSSVLPLRFKLLPDRAKLRRQGRIDVNV